MYYIGKIITRGITSTVAISCTIMIRRPRYVGPSLRRALVYSRGPSSMTLDDLLLWGH